tara:strand:+ start:5937 stop:7262 length:1326 start_codon:yes stop_codon:yes gene_type:complete
MKTLHGWARYPKAQVNIVYPDNIKEVVDILSSKPGSFIARGNGRSYGDASFNKNLTISMIKCNKFISLNTQTGELIAQSGVLIADIIDTCLPKGWFPFVTAGTKFITLGGAIAADVHGKNHHIEGSFGHFVNWFELIDIDGIIKKCSREENKELFELTLGGMGLTGVITKCSLRLRPVESGWITQKTILNNNLSETLKSFDNNANSLYSVAWIDCLAKGGKSGRSVLMLGEHASSDDLNSNKVIFPVKKRQIFSFFFDLPSFLLNNITVGIFNQFYYLVNMVKSKKSQVDWDTYFYPLDSIKNWNRLYGKKGFFQFQCILPSSKSHQGYSDILQIIQKNSSGSFLAVLKKFGKGNNFLSFPMEGYTLALDFKVNVINLKMVSMLNDIVVKNGGRFYLAKDATLTPELFKKSNVNVTDFKNKVKKIGDGIEISSELSRRLNI